VKSASFTDDQLREALARVADLRRGGKECPAPERLVSSGRGELGTGENRKVIFHIGVCTACATAWKIAREVASERVPLRESAVVRSFVAQGWSRWAAAAAVLVIAVGLGVVILTPEREDVPVYRAPEGQWLRSAVAADSPLPRNEFVLRWTAGPEGTFYDIRVLGAQLEPLARAEGLDRPEYTVREKALAQLPPGTRILWQVTAHPPDGQPVESETFFALVD
jgi:hypothetical protein